MKLVYSAIVLLVCLTALALASGGNGNAPGLCPQHAKQLWSAGELHSDCEFPWDRDTAPPPTAVRDAWDRYYINMTRYLAKASNPLGNFAAAIVDSRDFSLKCTGVSRTRLRFQDALAALNRTDIKPVSWIFHGEVTAMWKCQEEGILPEIDSRTPHPDWQHMILYSNVEPCPLCFGATSYLGIRDIVLGASSMQLFCARGRTQHHITDKELAEHAVMGGKNRVAVRGPVSGLDQQIMSDFEDRTSTLTGDVLAAFNKWCPRGF